MKKSAEQGADYADTDYAASKEKKTSMEWSFDYNGLFEDSTAKKGKPSKKSKSKKKKKKGKSNKDKSKDYEDDDSEKKGPTMLMRSSRPPSPVIVKEIK